MRDFQRSILNAMLEGKVHPSRVRRQDLDAANGHREIFDAISEARRLVPNPDVRLVMRHVPSHWHQELGNIVGATFAQENIDHYLAAIRDTAWLRASKAALSRLAEGISDTTPKDEVRSQLGAILEASEAYGAKSLRDNEAVTPELFTRAESLRVPLGLTCFDSLRVEPGDMLVIAARPGIGKTAMLGTLTLAAARAGWNVLFFTLEMPTMQIAQRLMSGFSRIPLGMVRDGTPDMVRHADAFSKLPVHYEDAASLTVEAVDASVGSFIRHHKGNTVVVIDYLQLLRSTARHERRHEMVGHICREMKAIAKRHKVPVITAAQLSRNAEGERRRPQLSDLRESGDIEQTADQVVLMHRDDSTSTTDLRIAKYRNGETATLHAHFNGPICQFEDIDAGGFQ